MKLFDYLNEHLSESTKRALTSTQTKEILDCVSRWMSEKIIEIELQKQTKKQSDTEEHKFEAASEDGFMDELAKL